MVATINVALILLVADVYDTDVQHETRTLSTRSIFVVLAAIAMAVRSDGAVIDGITSTYKGLKYNVKKADTTLYLLHMIHSFFRSKYSSTTLLLETSYGLFHPWPTYRWNA